jgi:pimeloyl-ACP methyl ester carboxylesterase
MARFTEWFEQINNAGKFKGGGPLGHYGKVLTSRKAVTDGPFVESKEAIAGFFLIRAESLEQAVEVARGCPGLEFGQTVEVRAMVSEPDELQIAREKLADKQTKTYDDDLSRFGADGAAPLPLTHDQGYVENDGARIWYATYGSGSPVILLHGGLGHSGNWGYQVPALVGSGYRAVLIDSRGHGRSTRDARPFRYELMASDVLAVMDALHLEKAGVVGWSDGATIALILAMKAPTRVAGVYFFACNMDPSGLKQIKEPNPILDRCLGRHAKDYARFSATPDQFKPFAEAVSLMMKTQPNCSAADLAQISVPVVIVHSEHDEFIKREHAEYLARTIPNAELVNLAGVSHFAPLQRPEQFNVAMLGFLGKVLPP